MTIKEKDFIEIDFVGRLKINDQIFDLTKADVAKKQGVFREGVVYEPIIVCVGSGQIIPGLDAELKGRKIGDKFKVEIPPEKGFGKRSQKLIQLTSEANFKSKGVRPVPGMQFDVDGRIATIKSVNSGRVILDFNHPLAGKELIYEVEIKRKIEKPEDRFNALKKILNLDFDFKIKDKNVELSFKNSDKLDKSVKEVLQTRIQEFFPDLKIKVL